MLVCKTTLTDKVPWDEMLWHIYGWGTHSYIDSYWVQCSSNSMKVYAHGTWRYIHTYIQACLLIMIIINFEACTILSAILYTLMNETYRVSVTIDDDDYIHDESETDGERVCEIISHFFPPPSLSWHWALFPPNRLPSSLLLLVLELVNSINQCHDHHVHDLRIVHFANF